MPTSVLVHNLTQPVAKPARVRYCESFRCRLRGLMFRPQLARDEGLLLVQPRDSRFASSIHMLFVPFDLAVFWINSDMTVVDKVMARSWRPAYVPRRPARYILEIHPELWDNYDIGHRLELRDA